MSWWSNFGQRLTLMVFVRDYGELRPLKTYIDRDARSPPSNDVLNFASTGKTCAASDECGRAVGLKPHPSSQRDAQTWANIAMSQLRIAEIFAPLIRA